jgi:hypothetical protein
VSELSTADELATLAGIVERLERVLDRLEARVDRPLALFQPPLYATGPLRRPVEEIERRRIQYRPERVRLLFIVPAVPVRDPPEMSDFYLANAHLYRSIRAAFVMIEGESSVPSGDAFLAYFQQRGCWVVALPGQYPPDRGRPSRKSRAADAAFVVDVLREASPAHVIAITPRASRLVDEVIRSRFPGIRTFDAVKVPKDLWQQRFVPRFGALLGSSPVTGPRFDPDALTVGMDDLEQTLTRSGNKRMRVYQIAEQLAASGKVMDGRQIRSAIRRLLKQHRTAFDQNGAGIRLRAAPPYRPAAQSRRAAPSTAADWPDPRRSMGSSGSDLNPIDPERIAS